MARAWVHRSFSGNCLALTLLLGLYATLTTAQQQPKPHASPAPRTIILPPKLVAGAPATLAVLDSQGRLLPNVTAELSGGRNAVTDATGRAIFKAPDQPGTLVAKAPGFGVTASATVVASEDSAPHVAPDGAPGAVHVASYPHAITIHDRFTLEGAGFRAAADSNHVYLNGDPCLVVASSPVSLVALPGPSVPIGDITLHVAVGGVDAGQFPVSAVLLEFSGPTEAVNAGSTGKLIVHARGTTEPLLLEVRNGSPAVIQLSKGNVQRLKTSGGDENSAPVDVKFETGGNYSVSARLLSAIPHE
jgi:hypothetical protein